MKQSVLVLLLTLWPVVAAAGPVTKVPSAFDETHVGVEGLLGLGTPLGVIGAALFYSPHPLVSLEVGTGMGLSKNWQRAAMVRVEPRFGQLGTSVGLGVSSGEFTWYHGGWNLPAHKHWDNARWANLELGLTVTSRQLQFRTFVGYSRQLAPDVGCTDQYVHDDSGFPVDEPPRPCDDDDGTSLIYTGAALRFAMPLGL